MSARKAVLDLKARMARSIIGQEQVVERLLLPVFGHLEDDARGAIPGWLQREPEPVPGPGKKDQKGERNGHQNAGAGAVGLNNNILALYGLG